MDRAYDIIHQVAAAKEDPQAADDLVRQYLPFIKAETAKLIRRPPQEGQDDELGIAMFAFHEAVLAYSRPRGAFLPFAAAAIRNRLIDFQRQERRHSLTLSLDSPACSGEDSRTLLEQLDTGHSEIDEFQQRSAAREEILDFSTQLKSFGLHLTDIAENCPKQERTLQACLQALSYAKANPVLLEQLITTHKLPIGPLAAGSGVARKTLERHRKYLIAILLAYTNGFEIIRGHLCQMALREGGRNGA